MAENESEETNLTTETNQNNGSLSQKAGNTVDTAKKVKDTVQKVKNVSLKGPILHILLYVAIAIIIIIFIVGIVMFLITMPGMVMEKLKELSRAVGNALASWFGQSTCDQVEEQDIYNVLDHLETMGYDLKGEGFITRTMTESDVTDATKEKIDNGVIRNKEDGKIKKAESDFINIYLVSDNYVYTAKNFNLDTGGEDGWQWWDSFAAIGAHIIDFLSNSHFSNEMWGTGIMSIYIESDLGIGMRGDFYGDNLIFNKQDIDIDASSRTMSIKRGWGKSKMVYSLDGWTGRYGMPLEFLLSVHLATQMPDLAFDMATNFDTEIEILLHDQKATAVAGYKEDFDSTVETRTDPTYITYSEMEAIKGVGLNKKEAQQILLLGIASPEGCTYTAKSYMLESRTDNGNGWILDRDNKNQLNTNYGYKDSEWEDLDTAFKGDSGFTVSECMLKTTDSTKKYNSVVEEDAISKGYSSTEAEIFSTSTSENAGIAITGTCNCSESPHELGKKSGYAKCPSHYAILAGETQDVYCKANTFYKVERTETQRKWYADVDGEDVEYTWATYCYKVYSYTNSARTEGKKYEATYLLDYVSRDKNTQELIDCGVLNEDGTSKSDTKCSEDKTLEECCETCRKYVKKILSTMNSVDKEKFKTYMPYISKVTDHWFRNVYFAVPKFIIGNMEFIQNDEEYEATMKERWTLYETNPNGTYKLYEIDENGEFKKDGSGNAVEFNGTQKEANEKGVKVAKKADTVTGDSIKGWKESTWAYSAYEEKDESTEGAWEPMFEEGGEGDSNLEKEIKEKVYVKLTTHNDIVQVEEGQRGVTNSKIKQMFLNNKYFKYDGSTKTAEVIENLRNKVRDSASDYSYGTFNHRIKELNADGTVSTWKSDIDIDSISAEVEITGENGTEKNTYEAKDYVGTLALEQNSLSAFSMLENTHTQDADYIYKDFKELIVELGYFDKEDLTETTPQIFQWFIPEIGSGGFPKRALDKKENEFGTFAHSKGDYEANEKNTLRALFAGLEEDPALIESNNQNNRMTPVSGLRARQYNKFDSVRGIGPTSDGDKKCSEVSVEEFLEKSKEIMDYMMENNFRYYSHPGGAGIGGLKSSWSDGMNAKNVCCATYVSWVLQELGVMSGHTNSCEGFFPWIAEVEGIQVISSFEELQEGDILFYSDSNKQWVTDANSENGSAHVDIFYGWEDSPGGKFSIYSAGHCLGSGCGKCSGGGISTNSRWTGGSHSTYFAIRLPFNGNKQGGDPYEGYEGGEAVVSPATGILLDYGTYDGTEDRENVDLKYKTVEKTDENGNVTVSQELSDEKVIDKVGYAKILVLDQENFLILEEALKGTGANAISGVLNQEKENSFISKDGTYVDNPVMKQEEALEGWEDDDMTLYGYKEFGELYEKFNVSGYVLFIDGFKCELPNPDRNQKSEESEDGETGETEIPLGSGTELSLQYFKDNAATYEETLYEAPERYRLSSQESTNKLNNEEDTKTAAKPLVYLSGQDLLFIKEGTVIGRTISDKELLEDPAYRNGQHGTYEELRGSQKDETAGEESEDEENKDKGEVIGNYIKIAMLNKEQQDTYVENVEEYLKLDELGEGQKGDQEYQFQEGDLDLLADAIHHEGCGVYDDPSGSKEDQLYLSKSVGFTMINKLNSDSQYTHAAGWGWSNGKSKLYELLCVVPCAAHGGKGWYAISDAGTMGGLKNRADANQYEYCDLCMEAAEYIKENDSLNLKNNGKYESQYTPGEGMPHTCWQQGGNYTQGRIWAKFRSCWLFDPFD